jgi:hypothetical protein
VGLDDRDSSNALDPAKWTRTPMQVVDPTGAKPPSAVLRVTYAYESKAVVSDQLSAQSTVDFVMLADDYTRHAQPLIQDCSDGDPTTDASSLWYHFQPTDAACQTRMQAEATAIQQEEAALAAAGDPAGTTVGPQEAGRWFMPVTAKLDPPTDVPAHDFSPEYDRLYGVGTSKSQLVVYAFFGVNADETSADDILGQEWVRFLRAMLHAQPNFRVTHTDPQAMLLDVYVGGQKVANVTYDAMFSWILDQTGYPPEVGTDAAKIAELRKNAMQNLTERWIYWDLPVTVTDAAGQARTLTVEVRSFYGDEASTPDAQQHAEWRYLEAFWYGDVFLYDGHSHFGNGPLDPQRYGPQNFDDRYQLMLVNSCLSYNYYHEDFFADKPGGTKNLDMIVNGLPSYVWGGGLATGQLLASLIDGQQHTYRQLLEAMRVDLPWGETGYEPMRVADGELDNAFSQAQTPLTVKVGAPVYP